MKGVSPLGLARWSGYEHCIIRLREVGKLVITYFRRNDRDEGLFFFFLAICTSYLSPLFLSLVWYRKELI